MTERLRDRLGGHHRWGRLLASTAVLALALLAAPAYAGVDGDPPANPPANPDPSPNSTGTTQTANAGGCHVISTTTYLGRYCPDGVTGASIKELMHGEKFLKCWDDPMTPDELEATGRSNTDDATWYWYRCVDGIDEKDLSVHPPVTIKSDPKLIRKGEDVVTLGYWESQLMKRYQQQIPFPIAFVSPTQQPRVGMWVSFFDGNPLQQMAGDNHVHQVVVPAGGVTFTAVEKKILVEPLGAGVRPHRWCADGGHQAVVGEQPVEGGNCWWRYQKSSAGQPNGTYPVRVTAYWTVYEDGAGPRTVFNTFTKSQTTNIPVTEIQAINVPLS